MKQVFVVVLLVIGIQWLAYSQTTSQDDYTGQWENAASWVGGVAPPFADPANIDGTHLDLTINGYITRNGDIDIAGATKPESFIINDTLVIIGDVLFNNDAAPLRIGSNGLLIVIGNITFNNNTVVENDGIFVVSGNATFANGDSETYDNSGGGELFVQGSVTRNPDAEGADNWDNLDDIYETIYDFVMCGGGPSCVLPIKLSYFKVELQNDIVELRWATIMEENFQKFIVQRASNGIEFEDIGEVAGKGFDIYDIETKYSFDDKNPLVGFNYYRLKAVDLDDTFEFFGVKAVKVSAPKTVAVYPNPSAGDFIAFSVNFNPGESDRIVIVDQLGVEVFNGEALVSMNNISFGNKLRPGVYLVRYVANGFEQTTRILITN